MFQGQPPDISKYYVDCVDGRCLNVAFPLWAPFIFFATYPTIAFIRGPWRRWRRRNKGLCIACAYDLTGNVSGVCQECGAEIQKEPDPPTL